MKKEFPHIPKAERVSGIAGKSMRKEQCPVCGRTGRCRCYVRLSPQECGASQGHAAKAEKELLIDAARRLAIEADMYACDEGDRDDLEAAIEQVENLTGMRTMSKPTVPEVMPLVKDYYATPGNLAGGNLHIVIEDGNIRNDDIEWCLDKSKKNGDDKGVEICELLLLMSKTQRRKIYMLS